MNKLNLLFVATAVILASATASGASDWEQLLQAADSISDAGYHDSAAVLGFQSLQLVESEFDDEDTTIAFVLEKVGGYLNKFSEYSDAEVLLRRSLKLRTKTLGPEHLSVASSLFGLARSQHGLGRFENAESLYERSLAIRERELGQDHQDVAETLAGLGSLYQTQVRSPEAVIPLQRALDIYVAVYGHEHRKVGEVLTTLGAAYAGQMKPVEADSLFGEALRILHARLGENHPDLTGLYRSTAYCHAMGGRYTIADSLARKALAIDIQARGDMNESVGRSYFVIASINLFRGNYSEAVEQLDSSLTVNESSMGANHPNTGRILSVLAQVYRLIGRYDVADSLARRSITVRQESFSEASLDMAEGLGTLASACIANGKFEEADSLYEEAIAAMESICRPDFPDLAAARVNYAVSLCNQARYSEAEPLMELALEAFNNADGLGKAQLSAALSVVAQSRCEQGRYAEAEELYEDILDIAESTFGEDHPQLAAILANLSSINVRQREFERADSLAERGLRIIEAALGEETVEAVALLDILGVIALYQREFDESLRLLNRSLDIRRHILDPGHPSIAASLDNVAEVYALKGRYEDAIPLHEEAYSIRTQALGTEHPAVAGGLETYSVLHILRGDWQEALKKSREAFHIRSGHFQKNGRSFAEADALKLSKQTKFSADRHISCFFDSKSNKPGDKLKTCDVLLSSKGQVSDMIFDRRKPLVNEADPRILELADSLQSVQYEVSSLFVSGPGKVPTDIYRMRLDSLRSLVGDLETRLARASSSYRSNRSREAVSYNRLVKRLPENSTLVEYFVYDYFVPAADSTESRYAVALLSRTEPPQMMDLAPASEINSLIDSYRRHMLQMATLKHDPGVFEMEDYLEVCRPLREAVWEPLEEYLAGEGFLIIAPDGGLNMVSFAGLMSDDGMYLIEDYTIHYVSSGRDLLRMSDKSPMVEGLFAMGDPDYNASELASGGDSVDQDQLVRTLRTGYSDLRERDAKNLPGTRVEVENLISSWNTTSDEPVTAVFGQDATEGVFKGSSPGNRVIYLATHGFYSESAFDPDIPSSDLGEIANYAVENPLLASGLLLAGANRTDGELVAAGLEDGVVTAYEVSSMNLIGTELVVLSACETGLGRVESGEGVYGLRRAFQMAGASAVISALWPIPDEATADMMSTLIFGGDGSLAERMRAIQIDRIQNLRNSGKSDHPFSWGAFIATGDWR